jgi:hypothetical protein
LGPRQLPPLPPAAVSPLDYHRRAFVALERAPEAERVTGVWIPRIWGVGYAGRNRGGGGYAFGPQMLGIRMFMHMAELKCGALGAT